MKKADAGGIPVVSSAAVQDAALVEAARIVTHLLSGLAPLRIELIKNRVRVAVIGHSELSTDLPEYADLYECFPDTNWNAATRGVGATAIRPVCSAGEENLLGLHPDRYAGECILIHEFAHTMLDLGITQLDPSFRDALERAFANAIQQGRWANTYAGTNADEFWAEGAQIWFDAAQVAIPANGIHNEVGNRAALKAYDPPLAALLAQVFGDGDCTWHYVYSRK